MADTRNAQVAIRKIGEWKPGKFSPYKPVQVIVCKELATGKDLNLSLNKKSERRVNDWLPAIVVGNVLTVTVRKDEKGREYIDFMGKFSLDRNLNLERSKKNVQSPTQKLDKSVEKAAGAGSNLALGLYVTELKQTISKIERDYPELFS